MEVGRLTPGGVTTMTTFDILSSLSQGECPRWISVTAPMVILATRRYQPSPPIVMPRDVTITGVDSISWGAYDWSNLQKIRFTDYNLNLQDIRRLVTLPNLSHVAFAFYYDVPLGLFIIEELASSNKIQCVLVVIYVTQGRQEQDIKEQRKKMLQQLDEPKLVVWEDTPDSVDMMETEESDRLWKQVAAVVAAQTSEKQAALSRG